MTDAAHGFVRFHPPAMNGTGDWYIRSIEQDYDGNWWYLAFNNPVGQPMIVKVFETSFILTTTSEAIAHDALLRYYTYHEAPELYSAPMSVAESKVMEFA